MAAGESLAKGGIKMKKPTTVAEYRELSERAQRLELKAAALVDAWLDKEFEPWAITKTRKHLPGLPGATLVTDTSGGTMLFWYNNLTDEVCWR